ncbi:GNAT family N-acetyltransferase [Pleurocapsa sp. PCC 7319]|uniref:GNAT family N-acetyltransferase n=1 Tax=Pleurocapsa sp. PCC 7319 TaxID=118161 RepID=UPI00034950A3|nr:GNAT family N-acetyltransferase [Pleurocapsa sp. PCC 7319]
MLDKNIVIKKLDDKNIPQFLSWRGTDRYIWQILEQEIVYHNKGTNVIFIAKLNETIIGTAQFVSSHCDRELADGKVTAYLQALDVKLQYRRQGIGSRLVTSVKREALFRGFERLSVIVEPNNNPALNLYQKLDFREFKRSTDCWQGKEYPVICLIKNIVC